MVFDDRPLSHNVKNKNGPINLLTNKDNWSNKEDVIPSEKIAILMHRKAWKKKALAAKLGLDPSYFGRMLAGKQRWQLEYLEQIAEVLDIPLWELFRPETEVSHCEPLQPIITVVGQYPEVPSGIKSVEYFSIPLVEGRFAAGYAGAIPGDYINDMVWVYKPELGNRQYHGLRAVRLSPNADSMSPTIRPNDIVIIDPFPGELPPEKPVSRNYIYALRLDDFEGACVLKRVRENKKIPDFWFLVSDNHEYEPIVVEKKRSQNLFIGRIIWSWTSWVTG